MITVREVAAMAGVSTSTVSRTLSGKIPVSEATRQKVMRAVQALNYHPNVLAKGLKEGKTNILALVIPNITNPLFPAVARGAEDKARSLGYNVILCNTDGNSDIEKQFIREMNDHWVDGFIFATASDESKHLLDLHKSGTPMVLLIRDMCDDLASGMDRVILDNYKGALMMTRHLVGEGHRRIAIINGRLDIELYSKRFQGYCDGLREVGLEIDEDLIWNDRINGSNSTYTLVREQLKKGTRVDAVFAVSDPRAWSAIRAIRDEGLRVPEDVSVVGFDNLETSMYIDPPLTTMSQPLYKMGGLAVTRLIERIQSKDRNAPRKDLINSKLVIRKSDMKRM